MYQLGEFGEQDFVVALYNQLVWTKQWSYVLHFLGLYIAVVANLSQ